MIWHKLTPEKTLEILGTKREGLSLSQADEKLRIHGPNILPAKKPDSLAKIIFEQFKSPVIYLLLIAALIVLALGDTVDAIVIVAVLVINAGIGAYQEGKAQNTLRALENFVKTEATVIRGGDEMILSDEHIVPGDIVFLKEGDKIPADARILELSSFRVDESALTGESVPVSKTIEPLDKDDIVPADQTNMVFRGTFVVGGNAYVVVTTTGLDTVIGEISQELKQIDTEVPLKENIKKLSRVIIVGVVGVCLALFILGIFKNFGAREMFATVVAISVSAIPSGLPMVVTIILAAGVHRMSKRNALVRKLQAVEALGQASVIAVDKTGTITLNQMMVSKFYADGKIFDITGSGYGLEGDVLFKRDKVVLSDNPLFEIAGKVSVLTAFAEVAYSEENKSWKRMFGDPTEAALLVFAQKLGFHREGFIRENPILIEIPFDSSTGYHAVLGKVNGENFLAVAGAPETIIPICNSIFKSGKSEKISNEERQELLNEVSNLSKQGLRVIALAYDEDSSEKINTKLTSVRFLGLVAIEDSLRQEVSLAVEKAGEAGIKVVMITGDHKETAKALAQRSGIWKEGDLVVSGDDLKRMTIPELKDLLPKTTVFARVAPEHKLKIIEAYRANGEIVAMTGDGVNDALSLAAADLGVSMGKIGTEVAKEASDIVLLDDNFLSIVSAVEEGRSIYATIKKVVLYLFSTSIGEIFAISAAMLLDLPLPLVASQIIWLNFVTDGFLVIALAMEPKEHLHGKSKASPSNLIDRLMVERMLLQGFVMMVGTIILFKYFLPSGYAHASTVALTTLAVFQWFNVWNCRTDKISKKRLKMTPALFWTISIVFTLQLLAVYTPTLQSVLRTTPLSLFDWMLIVMVASSIIVVDLIWKEIDHKRKSRKTDFVIGQPIFVNKFK